MMIRKLVLFPLEHHIYLAWWPWWGIFSVIEWNFMFLNFLCGQGFRISKFIFSVDSQRWNPRPPITQHRQSSSHQPPPDPLSILWCQVPYVRIQLLRRDTRHKGMLFFTIYFQNTKILRVYLAQYYNFMLCDKQHGQTYGNSILISFQQKTVLFYQIFG